MTGYRSLLKVVLAAGAVLLCAGCTSRQDVAIANKDGQIREDQVRLAQDRADNEAITEQNKALADQNNLLAEKGAQAAAANARATQDQAAQTAALSQKVAEQDALLKDLGAEFKKGHAVPDGTTATVHENAGNIHLTVAGSALFDPGKAELKASAHTVLLNIARTIKARYPSNYLRIEGHTDSTPIVHTKGQFKDNMALSLARAQAVYEFLHTQGGIASVKMYTAGYGENSPLIKNEKTAADRAKNRRVEIVIMPQGVKVQKDQLAEASKPVRK